MSPKSGPLSPKNLSPIIPKKMSKNSHSEKTLIPNLSLTLAAHQKRNKIINGKYEPASHELLNTVKGVKAGYKPSNNVSGVPNFWYKVLEKNTLSACWLENEDGEILKNNLKDIRLTYHDSENLEHEFEYQPEEMCSQPAEEGEGEPKNLTSSQPKSSNSKNAKTPEIDMFTIHFDFSPNNYFHNKTLTKSYFIRKRPQDTENPFNFDRTEIFKAVGCHIDWKKDKNLTQTIVSKKQKNKATGAVRCIKKIEKNDSFFHFFAAGEKTHVDDEKFRKLPENAGKSEEDLDALIDDLESEVSIDFDLGMEFRDTIIPNATVIFTNELEEVGDSDSEDETDSETESEEDEDEKTGRSDSGSDESDSDSESDSDDESDSGNANVGFRAIKNTPKNNFGGSNTQKKDSGAEKPDCQQQ